MFGLLVLQHSVCVGPLELILLCICFHGLLVSVLLVLCYWVRANSGNYSYCFPALKNGLVCWGECFCCPWLKWFAVNIISIQFNCNHFVPVSTSWSDGKFSHLVREHRFLGGITIRYVSLCLMPGFCCKSSIALSSTIFVDQTTCLVCFMCSFVQVREVSWYICGCHAWKCDEVAMQCRSK